MPDTGVSRRFRGARSKAFFYPSAKRAIDILTAGSALVALAPVCAAVALLIWTEDRGPVFYSQIRVGKQGQTFRFYKFRSMIVAADAMKEKLQAQNDSTGPVFKMRRDPRVTRIGRILRRYSLDELPQFWNVLRGDMSLVGPRPHLPSEVARYEEYQQARLLSQPGLICLREVSGRSELSFEQWIEMDLSYIETCSLKTDLAILCRAVPAVLKGKGAY